MSLDPAPPTDSVQAATDKAEAAATRRRWVSIAELVAIAGVIIAALSLYTGWTDRRADEAARRADKQSEAKVRSIVRLEAKREDGGDTLTLSDPQHPVQSADLAFPHTLDIPTQSEVLKPEIDSSWIAKPILALTAKGPDKAQGRIPVLISASYWDADQKRTDVAIYDVVWKTEGRFLRGRTLKLEGLLLRERGGTQARLDAIWARENPAATAAK